MSKDDFCNGYFLPDINSVTLLKLTTKLEYWFSRCGNGFYKFIEPCEHRLYREGDSWCEQLDTSGNTFRKYLKQICNSFQSKGSFVMEDDPFNGRPYASYFDRIRKITFYFRNPQLPKQLKVSFADVRSDVPKKFLENNCGSNCGSIHTKNKNINTPPKTPPKKQRVRKNNLGNLNKQTKKNSKIFSSVKDKEKKLAEKIRAIWCEETKGMVQTPKLSDHFAKKLVEALERSFNGSVGLWRKYCQSIASSKFLMGSDSQFKAWLIWSIREDVVEKVKRGILGIKKPYDISGCDLSMTHNEIIQSINSQCSSREIKLKLLNLLKIIGRDSYASWFIPLKCEERSGCIVFKCPNRFTRDYLQNNRSGVLRDVFRTFKLVYEP